MAAVASAVPELSAFVLPDEPGAVRLARRHVVGLIETTHPQLADDVALVVSELVGNAYQHGAAPIVVRAGRRGEGVRIEVEDASPRTPVRTARSVSNMTGRGITLIDALTSAWGVEVGPAGKTVWAEIGCPPPAVAPRQPAAPAGPVHGGARTFRVELGDVPTGLLLEAKAHIDNLVREFSLAAADPSGAEVPEHLRVLVETVVHGFSDARDAIKRQAIAAAERGDARTRLVLDLQPSAAAAGAAYLSALDEADRYARAARLLTLEAPPEHRLFRRWYVGAVIAQLGGGAEPVAPPKSFEQVLVDEVRRLSAAQRVTERAARLQRMTAALAEARTPEDVARVVVSEGVDALEATGGGLLSLAGDGLHLTVAGAVGYGESLVEMLRDERIEAQLPGAVALRTGEPVWLESVHERDAQFPLLRGFEAGTVAMCAVPLTVGGRRLGALRFSFGSMKLFDEDERAFVLALAALTAQTLRRTEMYEAEREAAVGLQRALLPDRLAEPPGWTVAAQYNPAGGLRVGGDFYDVFDVGAGQVVALIGDVMGRGVAAAAAMGQVRSTIRAYALDDPEPASVMDRTDAYFAATGIEQLVTVLYLLVDSTTGDVTACNAGHLSPVLLAADGTSSLVEVEVGLPFGVLPDRRSITRRRLAAGEALLLYTDGLVERPGEDVDTGIGRLLAACHEVERAGGRQFLKGLTTFLRSEGHDDDVTVLLFGREAAA